MLPSTLKKLTTVIGFILLTTVLVGAAAVQVLQLQLLSVQTGSMRPGIDPGDMVAVTSIPNDQLAVGDVITFIPDDKSTSITHRISEIDFNKEILITKGDANDGSDEPIKFDQVLGQVSYVIPYGGYVVGFAQNPIGLALLIYIPAFLIVISEIRRLAFHYNKLRPYKLSTNHTSDIQTIGRRQKLQILSSHLTVLLILGATVSAPVWAQLFGTATLGNNTISVKAHVSPPVCQGGQNSVNLRVSTSQSAQSGNVSNTNDTNGGSASSGNTSNSSSTSIRVNNNSGC